MASPGSDTTSDDDDGTNGINDTNGDSTALPVTLANQLVSWVVKVDHVPHLVVSHVADHPQDVPNDQWMTWTLKGTDRPVLIDFRTAQRMHGHRVGFVASLDRPGGPVVHAIQLIAKSVDVPPISASTGDGGDDTGTDDEAPPPS